LDVQKGALSDGIINFGTFLIPLAAELLNSVEKSHELSPGYDIRHIIFEI
jgi:hypothetical protein